MGIKGLLSWIKKKYPRAIRKTSPTFEGYEMLFIDMPNYVMSTYQKTKKPYSNTCLLISNILSKLDSLIQFAKPTELIFFSFECINGFLPYAKAITKRFRKIKLSIEASEREIVYTDEEEDDELLLIDKEFNDAVNEISKVSEKNSENPEYISIIQEKVDKINKNKILEAKKEKKERTKSEEELENIELDENELPKLLTVDEFMKIVKKADYDKEKIPNVNEFLIEFRAEFDLFLQKKMKTDPLYQNKDVVVSSGFVQGEAEHKIMSFLRNKSTESNWNPNKRIFICSNDNDLITLSLQTHIQNITILNNISSDLIALLVDINVLRDSIGLELNSTNQELAKRIDDIVLILNLVSNDYTPKLPDLPSSMDILFELYKSIIKENPNFILFEVNTKPGEIKFNIDSIKYFLNTLIQKTIAPDPKNVEDYLLKFKEKFPDAPIEEMSKSFFETIAWTMYLNKYGCPSYSHYYKYQYAPPLSTSIQYIDSIMKFKSINDFKNDFKFLSNNVLYVLNCDKKSRSINKDLAKEIKAPDSPIAYMLKDTSQQINIELTIKTVEKYEAELKLKHNENQRDKNVCYRYTTNDKTKNGKLEQKFIDLNLSQKRPFKYNSNGVVKGIFTPEFWPINEKLTFEQAQKMNNKMIFYNRPYKIPATIKKVLKYDDITIEERQEAFKQISIEDPFNSDSESPENEKMKDNIIFFKVTPVSKYQFKENNIKDVIVYAPYTCIVQKPNLITNNIIKLKPRQFVITKDGYYGTINTINIGKKTANVDCFLPSPNIDKPIREIVKNDFEENYITEEELAKQIDVTPESVPLITSRLIMMPDNSNIAIKFYSTRYEKLMCGFCIQQNDKFFYSKEAVTISKKYLNQPKIFKQLIEQSAAQTKIRIENEINKKLEKSEEPEIKTEVVPENSEEGEKQSNENNQDTNTEKQSSNEDNNEKQHSAEKNEEEQINLENYEDEDEKFEEKSENRNNSKERKLDEQRMKYLNEPEIDYNDELPDSIEIELPSDEETKNDPPYSIKLPTQIRPTIITRLDRFFKHHKTVYSSVFYPLKSTSLSIESIHKIDDVLSPILAQPKSKNKFTIQKTMNDIPIDQLICMDEYIENENQSFKVGDRIVIQKNRGLGFFGKYGTIICADEEHHKAIVCLDEPFTPSRIITITNYRMKNNFNNNCVIELPYSVLKLVNTIEYNNKK